MAERHLDMLLLAAMVSLYFITIALVIRQTILAIRAYFHSILVLSHSFISHYHFSSSYYFTIIFISVYLIIRNFKAFFSIIKIFRSTVVI